MGGNRALLARAKELGIRGRHGMTSPQLSEAIAAAEVGDQSGGERQTEVRVSYSYGIKANLGQGSYESADIHVSKSETWNVEGVATARVDKLWQDRYDALKEEIDHLVEEEYSNVSCFALKPDIEGGDDK